MKVRNNLTFSEIDGILYPDFEENVRYHPPVGIWGHRHAFYLKEFEEDKYMELLRSELLLDYLDLVDMLAKEIYEEKTQALKSENHITPTMRKRSPLKWELAVDTIHKKVKEEVYHKLVFHAAPVDEEEFKTYLQYAETLKSNEKPNLTDYRLFKLENTKEDES
ncbi:MAG: TnpV protein [Clostridia bacterium]|nr:TnpV protein [Clostridia bacterium]